MEFPAPITVEKDVCRRGLRSHGSTNWKQCSRETREQVRSVAISCVENVSCLYFSLRSMHNIGQYDGILRGDWCNGCKGIKCEDRVYEASRPQGTSRAGHDVFSVGDVEFIKMLFGYENGYRKVVGVGGSGHISK